MADVSWPVLVAGGWWLVSRGWCLVAAGWWLEGAEGAGGAGTRNLTATGAKGGSNGYMGDNPQGEAVAVAFLSGLGYAVPQSGNWCSVAWDRGHHHFWHHIRGPHHIPQPKIWWFRVTSKGPAFVPPYGPPYSRLPLGAETSTSDILPQTVVDEFCLTRHSALPTATVSAAPTRCWGFPQHCESFGLGA